MEKFIEQLARLSPDQRALFEKQLREKGMQLPSVDRIPHRDPQAPIPLTYAQQRLWFVQQFAPENTAYNVTAAIRLRGDLVHHRLENALNQIVDRHESLRTSFIKDEYGAANQQIHEHVPFQLPSIDLAAEVDPEYAARERIEQINATPFDLLTPPLRIELIKLAEHDHVLALATHHIVCDRWSVLVFLRHLAQALNYEKSTTSMSTDTEINNSGIDVCRPADYAVWERNQAARLSQQLEYWRLKLADAPPPLQLPTKNTINRATNVGSVCDIRLPKDLSEKLKQLSNDNNVSLFVVLLTAFKILLQRYSDSDDILVGTEVANRNRPETAEMIALLVNTLVLRTDLSGNPTFRELTQRVRDSVLGGLANQELPFEKLVQSINPERDLEQLTPLFQVKFDLQQVDVSSVHIEGLTLERFAIEERQTKYALRFNLQQSHHEITGKIEYSTELFNARTIERMAGHFESLLRSAIAQPDKQVEKLAMISETERNERLSFGRTADKPSASSQPELESQTLHGLFDTAAQANPDAIAVVDGEKTVSYRELKIQSDKIAAKLQNLGVECESCVGISMQKSIGMVATILGTLKAGGAYVPLAPDYPRERLQFIMSDAGVQVLASHDGIALSQDRARDLTEDLKPKTEIQGSKTAQQLAYVIYTSGSTGRPKGVAIEHKSATEMVRWAHRVFSAHELSGVLASTSISFDLSVFELFAPLTAGGTIILADNLLALTNLSAREQVTLVNTVPSLLQQLLSKNQLPKSVQTVNLAGEALPSDLVTELHRCGVKRVFNLYGPSEDTTYSTCAELHPGIFNPQTDDVHIGQPITGTVAYVLDSTKRLVPIGVPGELFLGGVGLARGYLNQAALTTDRFISNPLETTPDRLYRTGDRVRWREDGNLDFLGRYDQQFKIRGFRIEAGEIEIALRSHPSVQDTVIVPHEMDGETLLAGYVVATPRSNSEISQEILEQDDDDTIYTSQLKSTLHEFLNEQLPPAMVPTLWCVLDKIPRLPNGKIDRSKLPKPDKPTAHNEYMAPRNETEKVITQLWQEILQQSQVGVNDNFFQLGGHSLLAIQLTTQLENLFNVRLPLRKLFEMPTVAQMALFVQNSDTPSTTQQNRSSLEIDLANRHEPFPLTDIQQAYWLGRNGAFELGNIATHGYREIDLLTSSLPSTTPANFTTGNVSDDENVGVSPQTILQRAFNQLIRRHDMLRMVVQDDGLQRILPEVPEYEIVMHELTGAPEEIETYCQRKRDQLSHQVFETNQWPLFHIEGVSLSDGRIRFFISFDVLLGDAWSLQILGKEMASLLTGMQLPSLEVSFRDFVLAEKQITSTETYQTSWQFWQEKIDNLPPPPELPLTKSPAEIKNPKFTRRSARIESKQWSAIQQIAQRSGLTASGIIFAAFAEILGTWSRKRQFTVNLTLFNRPPIHADIDSVVGDFTSSLLLGIDQPDGDSFIERARMLQSDLWDALEHRTVSGVRVIRELARQKNSGAGALMPVVFTSTLGKIATNTGDRKLQAEVVYGLSQTSQVYLDHQVSEIDGELILNWDVIEELWPADVLDEMFAAYMNFVRSISRELSDVNSFAYHVGVMEELNNTSTAVQPYNSNHDFQEQTVTETPGIGVPPEATLHQLFLEQARKQPQAPAILEDNQTITYGELAKTVVDRAQEISDLGISKSELVVISMPKGWQQIAACLAVQTAGAAYVPIDVKLPVARRQRMINDTSARLVLTEETWEQGFRLLPESNNHRSPHHANTSSLKQVGVSHSSSDLAYVIYTSGSTGTPKGVMIDHRGAANTIIDVNKRINLTEKDRVFAISSLSFDLSVFDLFGTLAAGAAIVIGTDENRSDDPQYWLDRCRREGVTIWNSVPALMQLLINEVKKTSSKSPFPLRSVLLSGDWIPLSLPNETKVEFPSTNVFSLGGATEASIWSIIHPIEDSDPDWISVPYGRPLTNQTWYVLDENLQPCPPWVPGELYIGGIGVALGYWNRPQLTAERFIPNPFSDNGSPYLYRTGDWGRIRWSSVPSLSMTDRHSDNPNNRTHSTPIIEFLGREDSQVKVNGHRIELGEIEAALNQHPAIESAVASVHGNPPELIAYVVPNTASQDTPENPLHRLATKANHSPAADSSQSTVELPQASLPSDFRRQSHRQFLSTQVTTEQFASFLQALHGKRSSSSPLPKFRYPSAGSLYPIEIFVSAKTNRIEGVKGGWYRYDSKDHRLVSIDSNVPADSPELYSVNHDTFTQSAFTLFLVAKSDVIDQVYGERARDFCLIEAGYIGQLLMEHSPNSDIGLCPVNEQEFSTLHKVLKLGDSYECLHGLIGGKIDPTWSERWMAPEQAGSSSFQDRLRANLSESLPKYMIPSRYHFLSAIPLTANGKVDRHALPIPTTESTDYTAPRTPLERKITDMWQRILSVDQVGIHNNFFQLGGNSLQAIQLLSELRSGCHVELTMGQLFETLTPAAQAELITSLGSATAKETIPRVARASSENVDALTDKEVDDQLKQILDLE